MRVTFCNSQLPLQELNDAFRGYVLTKDNMVKLVDVAERLRASLPCILMGEAGCGKTVPFSAIGLIEFGTGAMLQVLYIVEGSLEVKLPTIWTDEKQSRAEAERREKIRREKSTRERVRRKKMQMREKVGKSRNTVFFQ